MHPAIHAVIMACCLLTAHLGAAEVVVTPSPATVVLRNPLKGFRPSSANPDSPYGTICHLYVPWNALEPHAIADDATAIARIRAVIDGTETSIAGWQDWRLAASRGYRVIPRVYLLWPGSPDRLYWPSDLDAYDFFSAAFLARVQNLVRRMGLAFTDDPRLAGVCMGIHGLWGEHHLYGYESRYPGKDTHAFPDELEPLYSAAFNAAFPGVPILRRYPTDFQDQHYGVHWDSFAHPDLDNERDAILAMGGGVAWKTALISGEVAYDWGRTAQFNGANPDDSLTNPVFYGRLAAYARLLHANDLGWVAEYTPGSATATGAGVLQDALGWTFAITEARFAARAEAGGDLSLMLSVRNTGSSPLYQAWPVGVALLDPTTLAPVWRSVMGDADVRTWMPGSDFDVATGSYRTAATVNAVRSTLPLPATLATGDYLLAVALLDPAGMRPNGHFAIANIVASGWQPLGRIGIGKDVADPLALPAFTDPNARAPAYVFARPSVPVVTAGPTATPAVVDDGQTSLTVSAAAPDGAALSVTYLVFGPAEVRLSGNGGAIGVPVTARFSRTGTYEVTAFVVGTDGTSVRRTLTIAVNGLGGGSTGGTVPAITSALVANGTVGQPFTYRITASGDPTAFAASPVPAGLTMDQATGAITGTPMTPGSTTTALTATAVGGQAHADLVITIAAASGGSGATVGPGPAPGGPASGGSGCGSGAAVAILALGGMGMRLRRRVEVTSIVIRPPPR